MSLQELDNKIQELDQIVMKFDMGTPIGLFDGKMGICIYFFHIARLKKSQAYQVFAEKMLENIYISVNELSSIDFRTGISGIAWGIHYLAENGFVSGNIDNTLRDVDDLLFRNLHSDWLNNDKVKRGDFLWLLFYYSDRIRTIKNKTEKELTQRLVIHIINHIENKFADIPWELPILFSLSKYELAIYIFLLSKFYQYDFYNYKIIKLWDNFSNTIFSTIPALHANRLLLLFSIQNILKCVSLPEWAIHAELLKKSIDHKKIVGKEFLNKNVTLNRGVSGYGLLLLMLNGNGLSTELRAGILEKIKSSDIWNGRFNPLSDSIGGSLGLASGYTGVSLIYHHLSKHE